MKLWHVMAATAWVAVFLWLARAAAGQLMVFHDGFMDFARFMLVKVC